ncbi:AraC family transcriptional regulator [Photobacterium jeanii]|uniref:AraC family transcriptional regulator n=1 Tax=Photobacterium jeanii TaxID=858640 RepID=A0A178K0X0_9GAMM|nr:helix-turn-helix transcriptional regulator [Photobacterium jeanii]OAN10968.1 AraC family transcriptional regulator [Photobacterium jeanii]PST90483.1 AraC family transcriptional regulator [Photobacterium jeanii]
MALITGEKPFNPDTLATDVVGIAADVGRHDSGFHHHQKAQLLFAPKGCMTLAFEQQECVLPPTRAAWIPPNTVHRAHMYNVVAYRSIYFSPELYQALLETHPQLANVHIVSVNELLRALIERMAFWQWSVTSHDQHTLLALFWQELTQAPVQDLHLPSPQDPRLQTWWQTIKTKQALPSSLKEMAKSIGASEKTITRIFQRDTGMSYQEWRQQWRLLSAIEHLSIGKSVAATASLLEFSSDSAFISFFKQHTGETPKQYAG